MANGFFKLLAKNRQRGFHRLEAKGDEATLWLYDVIVDTDAEAEFWGGVSATAFAQAVQTVTAPVLHVRINSPGGSVFAGRAMAQALAEYPGRAIAHVDGLAASAATFVAISCAEVIMAPGAMMMIHNASMFAWGDKNDLLRLSALLEKTDALLAQTYAEKAGGDANTWLAAMAAETWYSAQEAVAAGLATRVYEEEPRPPAATNRVDWDLTAFSNAPAVKAATAQIKNEESGADCAPAQIDHLRRRLDLVAHPA